MDFGGKESADFEISALIGLDVIAKIISSDAKENVPMKKINDILMIRIGNKYLPFGNTSSLDESIPKRKSLLSLGGPTAVKSAFLDVLLENFFTTEDPPLQKTMEEEINDSYEKNFKQTYMLVRRTEMLPIREHDPFYPE